MVVFVVGVSVRGFGEGFRLGVRVRVRATSRRYLYLFQFPGSPWFVLARGSGIQADVPGR